MTIHYDPDYYPPLCGRGGLDPDWLVLGLGWAVLVILLLWGW